MPLTLPYPNSPTNGDAGDADPIRANLQALAQGIQSFDGGQLQAGTIVEAAFASAVNPRLRASETTANYIVNPGCAWVPTSGFNATMTSGTAYYNGYRTAVNSVPSRAFTASKDTYVDVDYLGNLAYPEVSNGGASPALTANSQRIAKIVTNGSAITTTYQWGPDSLGNVIYNVNPMAANMVFFPTFLNGWVDYDTSINFGPSYYYRDKAGMVHIVGMLKNGTIGTVAFNLPSKFRPARNVIFPGASASAFCRIDVGIGGDVTLTTGNNSDVSLSSIQFTAMN